MLQKCTTECINYFVRLSVTVSILPVSAFCLFTGCIFVFHFICAVYGKFVTVLIISNHYKFRIIIYVNQSKYFFLLILINFMTRIFFDNKNSASTRLRVGRCFRSNWVKCSTRKNIPLMIYWHSTRGILKKYINFKNKTIWVKICIVNKSKIIR